MKTITEKDLKKLVKEGRHATGLTTGEIRQIIDMGYAEVVPWDELAIYYENKKARESFELNDDGIKNLYIAICLQAVDDYKSGLKHRNDKDEDIRANAEKFISECGKFFGEEFFTRVAGTRSREQTIQAIISEMRRKATRSMVL